MQPTTFVTFNDVKASRLVSGELLVSFSVQWLPGPGGKMPMRYGGGPYNIDSELLERHISYPTTQCVSRTGGLGPPGDVGC